TTAPTSTAPQPTPTAPPTGLPTALPTGFPTTLPPGYPTALPTLPGGLPSIPGKFPPIPGGIPRLPGGFPSIPGGFPAKPTPTAPTVTQLGDIATIAFTPSDNISIARTNGKPSIALSVVKKPDASTVDISHAITEKLPQLSTRIPNGSMNVVFDQAPYIEQSIDDLLHEGLLGLGMAVLVVFTFLLSIRLTLVTAVSIPASLMVAMIGLKASNNTLNILTLGALTIAIGRVVDDSIVVVENIARKLDLGLPRIEAITTAVREVAGAVTASTIVTVAVFLPIGVVGGQAGELFRPFAITVGIAMLASLLVSLTIVPVLAYWFVRTTPATSTEAHNHENGWMERLYIPTLHLALRRPIITMLIALFALVTAGIGAAGLKTQFIGSGAQNSIQITQTMPAGSTNEAVNTAATTVEKTLTNTPGVKTTMLTIGGSGLRMLGGSARTAQHAVTLEEGTDFQTLTASLRAKLDTLTDIGEIRIGTTGGPTNSQNVEIHIQGPDDDTLHAASEGLLSTVRHLEGVAQAHSDLGERVPSLHIDVNRSKALAKSVNEAQIGKAVADAVKGRTIGKIEIGAAEHDLIIREGTAPTDQAAIANLVIGEDHKGKDVHVEDVADLKRETIPASIHRIDGNRAVVITVTPADNDLGALTNRIRTALNTTTLPAGATATIGGAASDQAEAFNQLGLATLAAIAITYVVMVATFGSLAQPFMLLISIPFAGIGAVLALLLTGTPLGVPAFIGILMLVGIVVTNAIVLIDRVNQHRNEAMPVRQAVIAGARNRLRPIIMTALATILALAPMAASVTGGGAFISQPLALVVIGGLLSSTLLTLVIVPVLYVLLDALLTRLNRHREPAN
ncbi:MMPL family transporter, partial [Dermatophilus congolensis]|uniref:efflux RND transporter permease subunit n=1 Tax=Dermatophilus congolensis TaxID=1863 RepID=UPI001AAE8404